MHDLTVKTAEAEEPAVHIKTESIPEYASMELARVLFSEIHRAFEDPAVKADFERWKAARKGARGA